MKIITIQGKSNSGKTTLIRNIFLKLLKKDAEIIFFENRGDKKQDFHAVIIWKSRTIAFCSAGDIDTPDWNIIEEGLNLFVKYNANILINALSIDQGLTIDGYKNLLKARYNIKNFQEDVFTIESSKRQKRINCKKILRSIKQTLPCFYLDVSSIKSYKYRKEKRRKYNFSFYTLLVILITILANAVLNFYSKNDFSFLIFSGITIICLNVAIITSFFKQKKKTKYKAKLLSKDLFNTEDILIQNGTSSKDIADVHKATANAMADI